MSAAGRFAAILFDFDGVLIESEAAGNASLAAYLTGIGRPTTVDDSMARFMGLSGPAFVAAIEQWLGGPLPDGFVASRRAEAARLLETGLEPVAGAVAFVLALPPALPIAVVSSSTTAWIATHLRHIGLADRFGDRLYSGHEHVEHGKPAPDIYLHAARALGVPIGDCLVIEDSAVGARGAVASGATVVGLCAGRHCPPGHAATLRAEGVHHVAAGFDAVAALLG